MLLATLAEQNRGYLNRGEQDAERQVWRVTQACWLRRKEGILARDRDADDAADQPGGLGDHRLEEASVWARRYVSPNAGVVLLRLKQGGQLGPV